MAKPQEKAVTFLMTPCSSVTEHPIENDDDHDDIHHNYLDEYDHDAFLCNGCSCFRFFPFNLQRSRDESSYNLLNQKTTEQNRESWLVTKLKKMREVSEKLAGPKWKNLVRKIGGYLKKHKLKRKNKSGRFQYSPQSYALNFEDSDGDDDDDDVGFSSRFAPPPSNSKPNSSNPNSIVDDD